MKYYMIAGASSGIGKEVAKQISGLDTTVILLARREDKLREVQTELAGDAMIFSCDLSKSEVIRHVFEVLSIEKIKLDGLVYCAGICYIKPIKAMEEYDLEDMFRINVFGFYEMCKCFSQVSASNKGAGIVGISSYEAVLRESGMSAYAMTKEAMNVQAEVLAKEFRKRKIRINTIMPANVMSKMAADNNEWTEKEIEEVNRKQPLGIIPIENVVSVVLFLLSEEARYITGQAIAINAGYQE